MAKFKGIITAMVTPFTEDGEVYGEGIRNEIKYLHDHNIKNVFVCGSYGAFPIMSLYERKRVASIACDECKKYNMKTIVQIGSTSTRDAVELAESAEEWGADAISSVVPFYYSSTFYDKFTYVDYFKTLVNSVSIDVHCYNNSKTTGFKVDPVLLDLLIKHGVKGIKDNSTDMATIQSYLDVIDMENFDYYPSSTSSLITGFLMGVESCISGVSLTVPDLINSIYEDMTPLESVNKTKTFFVNIDKALETWKKVMKVRSILGSYGGRAIAAYYALNYMGVDVGECREPWTKLNRQQTTYIIEKLFNIGAL